MAKISVGHTARTRYIGLTTLVIRECKVVLQFWGYTLAPPIITTILYFVVFGEVLGKHIGLLHGVNYIQYMAPGLAQLWVINQAYGHTAGGLVGARFFKYIEELLVSPLPEWIVISGYIIGGAIRGMMVGVAVLGVTLLFTRLHIYSVSASCSVLVVTALVSAIGGLIAALFAKSFEQVYGLQNFVLTPLMYAGGIFVPLAMLPAWAQGLTRANPMFYVLDAFRYTVLGVSDVPFAAAILVTATAGLMLFCAAIALMKRGKGIRE